MSIQRMFTKPKPVPVKKPKSPRLTMGKVGKPTAYTPALLKKAVAYANDYEEHGDKVPSNAGLAAALGLNPVTLRVWQKDPTKPEIKEIIDFIQGTQERLLLNGGLSSSMNSVIVKLMLHNHGYSDKAEVDNTSTDGSMSTKPTTINLVAPKK